MKLSSSNAYQELGVNELSSLTGRHVTVPEYVNTPLEVWGVRTSSTIGIRPDPFSRGRL